MMYDKLIKWLWECASGECFNCSHKGNASCPDDLMKQAADAIEELQGKTKILEKLADHWCNKVPKWIPVTERLPEKYDRVLVFSKATRMGRDIDFINSDGNWFSIQKVTHWMTLPQPPKREEE